MCGFISGSRSHRVVLCVCFWDRSTAPRLLELRHVSFRSGRGCVQLRFCFSVSCWPLAASRGSTHTRGLFFLRDRCFGILVSSRRVSVLTTFLLPTHEHRQLVCFHRRPRGRLPRPPGSAGPCRPMSTASVVMIFAGVATSGRVHRPPLPGSAAAHATRPAVRVRSLCTRGGRPDPAVSLHRDAAPRGVRAVTCLQGPQPRASVCGLPPLPAERQGSEVWKQDLTPLRWREDCYIYRSNWGCVLWPLFDFSVS